MWSSSKVKLTERKIDLNTEDIEDIDEIGEMDETGEFV